LATVIASYYSDSKWIPAASYTMASLIGVSRIAAHEHWASDVFVGAVVGYTVGKLVYKLNRSKKIKLVVGL
jgi:membrane-associated phospholipid phosphatase